MPLPLRFGVLRATSLHANDQYLVDQVGIGTRRTGLAPPGRLAFAQDESYGWIDAASPYLASGEVGQPFQVPLSAYDTALPSPIPGQVISYALASGSLPPGIVLEQPWGAYPDYYGTGTPSTNYGQPFLFTGTPVQAGSFACVIEAGATNGDTASLPVVLTVAAVPPPPPPGPWEFDLYMAGPEHQVVYPLPAITSGPTRYLLAGLAAVNFIGGGTAGFRAYLAKNEQDPFAMYYNDGNYNEQQLPMGFTTTQDIIFNVGDYIRIIYTPAYSSQGGLDGWVTVLPYPDGSGRYVWSGQDPPPPQYGGVPSQGQNFDVTIDTSPTGGEVPVTATPTTTTLQSGTRP